MPRKLRRAAVVFLLLLSVVNGWMKKGNFQVGTFEELLADRPAGDNVFIIGVMARDTMETHMTQSELMTHHVTMVTMAILDFAEKGWLLNFTFVIIYMDDLCDPIYGIPQVLALRQVRVDVIIGMPCSRVTVPAGYLMQYLDIPVISYGAVDPILSDKDLFPTLVRAGPTYKMAGRAFVEVFKYFNWKKVVIVSRMDGLCDYGVRFIPNEFRQNQISVEESHIVGDGMAKWEIDKILTSFEERARVMILCLNQRDMINFLTAARAKNLLRPEFVYFTFALIPTNITLRPWDNGDFLTETEKEQRSGLFKYLKQLTVADMTGDSKVIYMSMVEKKMRLFPWYDDANKMLGPQGSPYGLYIYDTAWHYMICVNDTLADNLDPRSGRIIFQKSKNVIFHGASGEVVMDGVADRLPSYWLWQLNPGEQQFHHFAEIRLISEAGQVQRTPRVTLVSDAHPYWGTDNLKAPLDTPVCGFRDELCPASNATRDAGVIGGISIVAFTVFVIFLAIMISRKKRQEDDIVRMYWRVKYEDLVFPSKSAIFNMRGWTGKSTTLTSTTNSSSDGTSITSSVTGHSGKEGAFTEVCYYRGILCATPKPVPVLVVRELLVYAFCCYIQ